MSQGKSSAMMGGTGVAKSRKPTMAGMVESDRGPKGTGGLLKYLFSVCPALVPASHSSVDDDDMPKYPIKIN